MKISLIITTFNRPDALDLVIKSVENQTYKPHDVIIADDGSDDETKNLIKKIQESSSLNIIHSWHKNDGFRVARSRNQAVSLAKGDYLVLIDGDMVLDKYFLYDHLVNSEEKCFIQGSRVLLSEKLTRYFLETKMFKASIFQSGLKNRKNILRSVLLSRVFSNITRKIDGIKTCNMSFYKDDFYAVNGFNNNFEGWGREDTEFCVRLINSGLYRKNLKFAAVQFHLWHKLVSRKSLRENDLILEKTIREKLTYCKSGVSEYV